MGKTKTSFIGDTGSEEPKKKKTTKKGQSPEVVESTPETKVSSEEKKTSKAKRVRGKKYAANKALVEMNKFYSIPEAVELVKKTSFSKFDGSVELHLVIKKENVTVSVSLPHSAGKTKVVEFADENTLKKLQSGKVDFDILIATVEMMPKLVPFARILGPKGLMPNPKNGTLVKDKSAASKFSAGSQTIKSERKAPLVHTVAGKVSQDKKELEENIEAIINAMGKRQVLKAYVKASMGPSIKLALA